jgi:hypothetical protein
MLVHAMLGRSGWDGGSAMLEIGTVAAAAITVAGGDLAKILNQTPDDGFPPVLALLQGALRRTTAP